MKYLIQTSSLISSALAILILYQLNFTSAVLAGAIAIYWIIIHITTIQKERNLLKEGNQYFIDSFENIRTPLTLVHTPLKIACNDICLENIRQELSLAIQNIDYLNVHLTRLMDLKQLFVNSERLDSSEYELGIFIKNRIDSLQTHAANNLVELNIKTDFSYASAWFDQSKISPVIDRFIKNAIDHTGQKKTITLLITSNSQNWQIKIADFENKKLVQCYKCKNWQLLKRKEELEYNFAKNIFCKKLIKLCNGKILINHSNRSITLKFPSKDSPESVSKHTAIQITSNPIEEKIDTLFGKDSQKRNSAKPVVVLADSNKEFRLYLEERLSKDFIVKSFGNGTDALECIKEEYPDLVICDIMLHGMYGNELSSRLKTSGETSVIPIILYGSRIDIGQRSKRESSLADIFLYMPFHIEDLKIEMNVLIKNNRFLRKSFLQKIFGKQFLEVEEEEILDEGNYDLINQVKEFILRNIDKENLTIDEIASELYMSRTAFFTKWKALTGEAPKYLIYRIRMEKARELLESGNYSVSVLPEMIGLKNLKNFRHKYKEYFGITPSESITKKQ
ncbi:hybrid sensor histidine kinase/response regulator transcription factor [Bacteroides faecium]|uniref:Response regulator n=1 Tax=Bacteroides faecium TaxID=2715212 RepID=A0A6H0KT10_9BACE|nr:helix-turn-helix domain-containing protein [Bacteroides faecium]QIU96482.1 response regulator [Bacteroides faecium]